MRRILGESRRIGAVNPRGVLIGAAVVLISGCGTTVTGVKTSGGGNQGLSVPSVPGAVGPTSGGGPGTSSTAAGAGPGAVSGSAAESGGASGGGSATGVAGGAGNGPGLTASTIYVGDAYDPDTASADAALGAAGANPGDTKAETEAVLNYINGHGGIAHRKVVPVWYRLNLNQPISTSAESACQTWTQDHKV